MAGLTIEQLEYLSAKGFTADELLAFAALPSWSNTDATNLERQARYRARMDVSAKEWAELRAVVFERNGYACTYCGETLDLCCDHIVPLVQGGASTTSNLTTACKSCNSGKSGRTPEEWRGDVS